MEASIREPNIKNFLRLLQCAARFGDDLCIHANKDIWELAVTNSSKSAYCLFSLLPPFFSKFRALGNADQQRRGVNCQLYVKSVLAVIGKASSVNTVERIDLRIVDPSGGLQAHTQANDEDADDDVRVHELSARLEIRQVYHHGVVKKHNLHLHSSQFLRVIVDPDSTPSGFQISARELKDWLEHFSIAFGSGATNGMVKGDTQLAWRFGQQDVRVKNFESGPASTLSTEIKLSVGEFKDYGVFHEEGEVDLALPMREFKAALQLADQFVMDLDIRFSEASQPLTLSSTYIGLDRYNHETTLFEIFCAIATTKCEAFDATQKAAPPPPNATSSTTTRQPSIASSRERTASVAAPSNANQSRTPGRRQSATPSNRPSRLRASLSMTSEAPRAPATQTQPDNEPLFQSGGSQSIRLTQEEALEMAGFTAEDLDLAMDDADLDEEAAEGDGGGAAAKNEVPSGWDELSFDIPAENMSTQRKDAAERNAAPAAVAEPESAAAEGHNERGGPNHRTGNQTQFEADNDVFGSNLEPVVKPEPADEVDHEDEELDPDEIDATQDSGRKFTSFFAD